MTVAADPSNHQELLAEPDIFPTLMQAKADLDGFPRASLRSPEGAAILNRLRINAAAAMQVFQEAQALGFPETLHIRLFLIAKNGHENVWALSKSLNAPTSLRDPAKIYEGH